MLYFFDNNLIFPLKFVNGYDNIEVSIYNWLGDKTRICLKNSIYVLLVITIILHSITSFIDPGTYIPSQICCRINKLETKSINSKINSEPNQNSYENRNARSNKNKDIAIYLERDHDFEYRYENIYLSVSKSRKKQKKLFKRHNIYKLYESDGVLYNDGHDNICYGCTKYLHEPEFIPFRSHHVYTDGRCVQRFDHFCVWHSNEIGSSNLLFFYLFLVSVSLVTSNSLIELIGICRVYINAIIIILQKRRELNIGILDSLLIFFQGFKSKFSLNLLRFAVVFLTFFFVSALLALQTRQILHNETTYEVMRRNKLLKELHKGSLHYIKEVKDPIIKKEMSLLFKEKIKRFENVDENDPKESPLDADNNPYYLKLNVIKYIKLCANMRKYSSEIRRIYSAMDTDSIKHNSVYLLTDVSPFKPKLYQEISRLEIKRMLLENNIYDKGWKENIKDAFGGTKLRRKYNFYLNGNEPLEPLSDYFLRKSKK